MAILKKILTQMMILTKSLLVSNVDKETGLWSYKSVSNYKPMMSMWKEKRVADKRRLCYARLPDGGQTVIIHPLQKTPGLQ